MDITPFLIQNLLIFGSAMLLGLLVAFRKSLKYWYLLVLFLLIGMADNFFYLLTETYPQVQLIQYHTWNNSLGCNWSAKLYSSLLGLILFIPLRKILSLKKAGITLKQDPRSLGFSLILILAIFSCAMTIGVLSPKGPFDPETLIFLAIMPGINEELIYRGWLLGLLNKVFDKKFRLFGTHFGWGAILTSLVFGLLHGFRVSGSFLLHFDLAAIILAGFFGFIFALMKERSGSLLFPIIAHGTEDFFIYFFRMI